jgi:hypothetical protein
MEKAPHNVSIRKGPVQYKIMQISIHKLLQLHDKYKYTVL